MKTILRQLRSTLHLHTTEFARGAERHAALADSNPADVLVALRPRSGISSPDRNALTRALVAEVQASSHPLWSSLLLVAFEPALLSLRRRFRKAVEDPGELVMLSFLEAAKSVRTDQASVVMALHRAAVRKVLQQVPDEPDPLAEVPLHPDTPDVPWPHDPSPFVQCAAQEVLRECAKIPAGMQMALAQAGFPRANDPAGAALNPRERRRLRNRSCDSNLRALRQVRKALRAEPDS